MRNLLIAVVVLGACGGSSTSASQSDRVLSPVSWPETANTYNASSDEGCFPRSMLQVCEVPEGSVMHADGSITTPSGKSVRCEAACTFSEYTLECRAAHGFEVPRPAPALGCRDVPLPTPSSLLHFCCPGVP